MALLMRSKPTSRSCLHWSCNKLDSRTSMSDSYDLSQTFLSIYIYMSTYPLWTYVVALSGSSSIHLSYISSAFPNCCWSVKAWKKKTPAWMCSQLRTLKHSCVYPAQCYCYSQMAACFMLLWGDPLIQWAELMAVYFVPEHKERSLRHI